jgi:chromosome segregation protein
LVAELSSAEQRLSECEARKELLQGESEGISAEAERSRAALMEQRANQASAKERLSLFDAALEKSNRQLQELSERVSNQEKEIAESDKRTAQLVAEDRDLNAEIQKLGESQGEIREKLTAETVHLSKCRELLKVKTDKIRVARDEERSAAAAATALEVRLNELKAQIEAIREQAESVHEISLAGQLDMLERKGSLRFPVGDAVQLDLPVDEASLPPVQDLVLTPESLEDEKMILSHVETLKFAKRQIERLGEVNLAALEEYTELRGRYTYLEEQRSDLEESMDSIKKAIAQLNKTCRERFRVAFDQVERNFSELYPRLVGGGSASLSLTDENDLLETGIDILVQPPGKRLQSLSLLSGGEKAMTAIALIFSLFLVKPSPFCLLDEVDAPLDDSNGARFNNMLR